MMQPKLLEYFFTYVIIYVPQLILIYYTKLHNSRILKHVHAIGGPITCSVYIHYNTNNNLIYDTFFRISCTVY